MHRIGWAFSAESKRFLGLPLALLGLMLMASGEASARQCPRGQIWRVSRNVCAPKGEKLGALKANSYAPKSEVIEGRIFYGPTVGAKPSQEPEGVDAAPSENPAEMETPAAYVAAKRPKPPVSAPGPSPYGALSLDSFAKP
jgi:hypothetical protein